MLTKIAFVYLIGVSFCLANMPLHLRANIQLLDLMAKHFDNKFIVDNRSVEPNARSVDPNSCFQHYVPLLNEITKKYESDYNLCLETAEDARQKVDEQTEAQRNCLNATAEQACANLESCNKMENASSFFECFAEVAGHNSKVMYNISRNATDALILVREQIRIINFNEENCKSKADRTYVEDTNATYEQLTLCLSGKGELN